MTKKHINIRLDSKLYHDLVVIREDDGVPVTESLRRAVKDYIESNQAKIDKEVTSRDVRAAINKLMSWASDQVEKGNLKADDVSPVVSTVNRYLAGI